MLSTVDLQVTVTDSLVFDLTDEQVRQCCELTLPNGLMRPALLKIRGYMAPHVRNRWMLRALTTETVLLAYKGETLAGWGLVQCVNPRVAPELYLYVDPRQRRRGIGRQLLERALTRWPNLQVHPWDDTSLAFYESCPQPVRFHYMAERWLAERDVALAPA